MITDAITTLKERNGSSRSAIKKYVQANNKDIATGAQFDSLFNRSLKAGVTKGLFEQPKGKAHTFPPTSIYAQHNLTRRKQVHQEPLSSQRRPPADARPRN